MRITDLETALERIRQLEESLGQHMQFKHQMRLTPTEAKIFGVLVSRPVAFKEAIYTTCWGMSLDPPEPKIIDVFLSKIRGKLRRYCDKNEIVPRIEIESMWGRGYRLDDANKARVRALLFEEVTA